MARIDEETKTLIKQVAENLGASIDNFDEPELWYFKVRMPAGTWHESEPVTFGIRSGWDKKGSLHISSSFPSMKGSKPYTAPVNPYRYQEKRVEVNISQKKAPEKIAREIEKRFKDAYMVYYQRALETIQSHMEAKAGTAGTVERLQMASSGMLRPWGSRQEDTRWDGRINVDNDRVSVRVYNGKVDFEMRYMSEKTALKIAKVLGDLALAQSVEKEVA